MDVFVEQIIKRKKSVSDFVKIGLCVLAAAVVIMFAPTLLFALHNFASIVLLLLAGIIYLLYNLFLGINVEYEYAFTNGAFDVDKIIAARRRKRVTSLNARNIEIMAKTSDRSFRNYAQNRDIKKIRACTSEKAEDLFFVVYLNDGKKTMLLFNPNEKIVDGFRRLNPQNVILD